MRRYECVVIIDPDLSEDQMNTLMTRIEDLIPQNDGILVLVDKWGTRKLAYEIKKKKQGHYLRLDFCGQGKTISELERFFRIDDRVLKFLTVLLEDHVDPARIEEEIKNRQAEEMAKKSMESESSQESDAAGEDESESDSEADPEASDTDDSDDNDNAPEPEDAGDTKPEKTEEVED